MCRSPTELLFCLYRWVNTLTDNNINIERLHCLRKTYVEIELNGNNLSVSHVVRFERGATMILSTLPP